MPRGREAGVGVPAKALEDRQHERSRLPGAGLGGGEDVSAGQDVGDRRALNGRWFGISLSRHGGEEVGREAEVFESQKRTPGCVG